MAASLQEQHEPEDNEAPSLGTFQERIDTYNEDTGSLDVEEELPPAAKTSCAIDELQNAFGSILLLRRNKDPASDQDTPFEICSDHSANKFAKTEFVYQWTGVFDLFAFPRELRDRIYYHYVYCPQGLIYRRNTDRRFPFDDHPEEVASLFLTCRQVYHEAFQVFCRYNLIELRFRPRYQHNRICNKGLAGVIRLFPDKPARQLQHLGVSAERYTYYRYRGFGNQYIAGPTDAFAQMLRDAYAFEEVFPKLRDFTVSFSKYDNFFGYDSVFALEDQDEEDMITKCVEIMSAWLRTDTVVPPRWFRFRFDRNWTFESLRTQEDIWNKAYARLARERASRIESVEESGKVWIEKEWGVES
jgi:hypothetical protein